MLVIVNVSSPTHKHKGYSLVNHLSIKRVPTPGQLAQEGQGPKKNQKKPASSLFLRLLTS